MTRRVLAFAAFGALCALTLVAATAVRAAPDPALDLSDSERAWLAANPNVRLGIDPAWEPFEFMDQDGRYRGMDGAVDAAAGVLRVTRRGCLGGLEEGRACTSDSDCGGGTCEELFDFSKVMGFFAGSAASAFTSSPTTVQAGRKPVAAIRRMARRAFILTMDGCRVRFPPRFPRGRAGSAT